MNGIGAKTHTSQGVEGVTEEEIERARETASGRVEGFIFQFPAMKGRRVAGRKEGEALEVGGGTETNPEAGRRRRERGRNFIVKLSMSNGAAGKSKVSINEQNHTTTSGF